jgi:hypothetical protein
MTIAQHGLAGARERRERGDEARNLRALGEAMASAQTPDFHAADVYYHEALMLAEELGMRPLGARCHLGLGQLWRKANQPARAREHVTTAVTMLREMGMAYWLRQAEAELGAHP